MTKTRHLANIVVLVDKDFPAINATASHALLVVTAVAECAAMKRETDVLYHHASLSEMVNLHKRVSLLSLVAPGYRLLYSHKQ